MRGRPTPQRRPYSQAVYRLEKALRFLYVGGWPAALWGLVPASRRVHRLDFELPVSRDPSRPPLRLAFASDLHLGPTTTPAALDRAFAHLAEARADVLALGGDYVFLGATLDRVAELQRRVAAVPAATKIAVLGNHDFWARPERLHEALREVGVHVLVNSGLRLPPPHDDVAIFGLDDPLTGDAVLEAPVRAMGATAVKIALCHSPDGYPGVEGRGFDLFLAGHTHGGHIALPGHRPLVMPSVYGRLWPWGLHDVDGLAVFVSRGVGGSVFPFRTWAPPDVAVFALRPAEPDTGRPRKGL